MGLGAEEAIPSDTLVGALFSITLDTIVPRFHETVRSNFLSIVRGGLSTEYLFLSCYADYTASEYLLGAGPTSLTVAYDRLGEAHNYYLYRLEHDAGQFGDKALMSKGEYEDYLDDMVTQVETSLSEIIGGRESVVFLAPMGAHNAIAIEVWQAVEQWDLQTDDSDVVHAVRYGVPEGDPEQTQTLANLKSRITTAVASDDFADDRIANASGLTQYYRDIGAYGDITPDDGSTATFTPAQPPPIPTCANGTVVTSPGTNRGLAHDCEALLEAKDTLRGTASLDWSKTSAITGWGGITTGGTPSRVTKLVLPSESLSGTIPSSLGRLFELTHLNLSNNTLTGEIPRELGWLHNLEELRLSGNTLSGCIPLPLKDVATNDLSSLNLLYCQPPAPGNLTAGTAAEASIPVIWNTVSNASKYRVEYRLRGDLNWTVDSDAITGTNHTVDELVCDSLYQFRVSAYGSGTVYTAAWSDGTLLLESTGGCMSPVFEEDEYSFPVSEGASVSDPVGTVSATHPDDDTIEYTIESGNTENAFAIGTSNGAITVDGALDFETTPNYTLMIQAEDDDEDTDTVTVTITVTDVAEDPPPAPTGLSVTLTDGIFTISWSTLAGAAKYEAQHKTDAAGSMWTALPETTALTQTYTPVGGEECGTTYQFRVRAYGDGVTYTEMWGTESGATTVETAACNVAPVFDPTSFTFNVAEDAEVDDPVGTVTATDEDTGDELTYSITAGNEDGKYEIDEDSGAITVAGGLDHETTPNYTLTVQVDDGNGGTATASVIVTVTDVAEDLPPAPSGVDATLTDDTFTITWTAMSGVDNYEVQYRTGGTAGTWTSAGTSTTTTLDFSPTGGPDCSTTYDFRVRAHGDGQTYVADWGPESGEDSVTTGNCDPEFDRDPYSFEVAEDAEVNAEVGKVTATDENEDDELTYSITEGNGDGKFDIDGSSGAITAVDDLDHETDDSYTLTVEVDDGSGGMDAVEVTISITDVAEDPPPAPSGLTVSLTDGTFSIFSTALGGAAKYEAQHKTDSAGSVWMALPETSDVSATYAPEGGTVCSTEYQFRVRAYGDGDTYTEMWGAESEVESVGTATCDPEFDSATYNFTLSDGASVGHAVGSVSATDPDIGDTLTYSIESGNTGSVFSIGSGIGAMTVAGALDYENTSGYTLTVKVDDGNGGTDTATVTISLLLAECLNGRVVPRPNENPLLVRDCSILLTAKDTLAGDGTLNWSENIVMSGWNGVSLDTVPSLYVRDLLLTDKGLTGAIPASFGGLVDLLRLDLDENQLTGGIPSELGNMESLKQLYLFGNRLTGSIPAELSELNNLTILFLDNNRLSGSIPEKLAELDGLRMLLLDNNQLTGAIPSALGGMDSLEQLWLRDNQLTGGIPSELEDLSTLTHLYLEGNSFTGCIPAGLRDVENNDLDQAGLNELSDCSS